MKRLFVLAALLAIVCYGKRKMCSYIMISEVLFMTRTYMAVGADLDGGNV